MHNDAASKQSHNGIGVGDDCCEATLCMQTSAVPVWLYWLPYQRLVCLHNDSVQ